MPGRNRQGGTAPSDSTAIRRAGVCRPGHTHPDCAPVRNLASGASRPLRPRPIPGIPSANTPTNKPKNQTTNHLPNHPANHPYTYAPIHPLANLPLSRSITHSPLSSASLSDLSLSLPACLCLAPSRCPCIPTLPVACPPPPHVSLTFTHPRSPITAALPPPLCSRLLPLPPAPSTYLARPGLHLLRPIPTSAISSHCSRACLTLLRSPVTTLLPNSSSALERPHAHRGDAKRGRTLERRLALDIAVEQNDAPSGLRGTALD